MCHLCLLIFLTATIDSNLGLYKLLFLYMQFYFSYSTVALFYMLVCTWLYVNYIIILYCVICSLIGMINNIKVLLEN